jgi:hypothetical protein
MVMGEVLSIVDRKAGPRRKHEPKGFMLVPVRILEPLAKLEASVSAHAADTSNRGPGICWESFYGVVAILDMAARYE